MAMGGFFRLLRVEQWYKNLLVFLPLVFVKQLFSLSFFNVLIGFIALCLVSSSGYILNDIFDLKKDRLHPEKSKRPIASGRINLYIAFAFAVILLLVALSIALLLDKYFAFFVLALFTLTLFYSLYLKNEPFLDITIIGINFILRALSGAFIVKPGEIIRISPWLILCPFFLALFLAAGKRKSDLLLLGKDAELHKPALTHYTSGIVDSLMTITTTSLLICYALFSFNSDYPLLVWTLPIAVYIMLRYVHLINSGSEIARKTYLVVKDLRIMLAGLLWALAAFFIIYLI
ncbi:UbiA prenyltransferase family protein [Candidatus Woesearchaeota archaeon]|nr:UbiA prenyltransferase family protein [Candidatus Woesearchaeota archaeon]